jgi:hypothetical protein
VSHRPGHRPRSTHWSAADGVLAGDPSHAVDGIRELARRGATAYLLQGVH